MAVAIGVEGVEAGHLSIDVDEGDARIHGRMVGTCHDAVGELTKFALKDFEPCELPKVGRVVEFPWNIVAVDRHHNAHFAVPLDGGFRGVVCLPVYGCRFELNLTAEAHEEVVGRLTVTVVVIVDIGAERHRHQFAHVGLGKGAEAGEVVGREGPQFALAQCGADFVEGVAGVGLLVSFQPVAVLDVVAARHADELPCVFQVVGDDRHHAQAVDDFALVLVGKTDKGREVAENAGVEHARDAVFDGGFGIAGAYRGAESA